MVIQNALIIAYKALRKASLLDVTHLMQLKDVKLLPNDHLHSGVDFKWLAADDVRHFSAPEYELSRELGERLQPGRDGCYAAFLDGRLAAYAWFAIGSIEAEHNRSRSLESGVAISFPSEMAFMYKGFVHPEFRGRRLYGHICTGALESLKQRGVTSIISTAEWTNHAALTSCRRAGFEELGLIWRCGRPPLAWTLAARRGKRLGIRFARDAVVVPRTASSST